ncbi:putative immunity protein [Eisenbergiella sp.]
MAKLRKMLGAADSPYILSLMRLIETQSKTTLGDWCVDYAEKYILNIYEKAFPEDDRLRLAVEAYRSYRKGELKLPELKKAAALTVQAAKEAEKNPAAQAAARTIGQAIGAVYTPTHSLGLAFYGAAAIAYDRVGLEEKPEVYDQIAAQECAKMEEALRAIMVENEENPAKIKWYC